MEVYRVKTGSILPLGKQGENLVRQIQFDLSRWISNFGPGTVQLLHQRNGDEAPYPVAVEQAGNLAVWTVTNADTAIGGNGIAELQYYVGDALAKSETWMTKVFPALGDASETPPEAQQGWVDQVLHAGAAAVEAAEKAESAAVRQPIVGGNGNWWTWDLEAGAYVDTGIYSGGDAPYIGDNGNWYVGQTDTGVAATGPAGPAGPALAVTNTAAVGQTVKITAVDENGQPTEWEAVDMASGGGGTTSDEWIDLGTLTLADGEETINFLWEVNGQVKKIHVEGVYYSATSGKTLSLFNSDGLHGPSPLITHGVFKFPSSAEKAMYMDLTVEELYPGYWFGCGGSSSFNNPHENTIFSYSSPKRVDRYLSLGAYWRDTPLTAGTWFNVKVVYY